MNRVPRGASVIGADAFDEVKASARLPDMALVTISGYPCSGKSKRVSELKAALESRLQDPNYAGPQLKVKILSDEELYVSRDAYNGLLDVFSAASH